MTSISRKFIFSLICLLGMTAGAYFSTLLILKSVTPERVWNRESGGLLDLKQATEKLHKLSSCSQNMAVIIGSSISKYINIQGSPTINLSYAGPAPVVQDEFLPSVMKYLRGCDRSRVTVYLEYLPFLYTRTNLSHFHYKNQLKLSYLLSWTELWNRFPHNAPDTWEIMSYKMRMNSAPEMMSSLIYSWLPGTNKTQTMDESVRMYNELSDIKDLNLSSAGINRFINQVKSFTDQGYKVLVYTPPLNPHWKFTANGKANYERSLTEIQKATGTPIKMFTLHYGAEDFSDAIHPSRSGTGKMNSEFL